MGSHTLKFKVGQRVIVVANRWGSKCVHLGETHTIESREKESRRGPFAAAHQEYQLAGFGHKGWVEEQDIVSVSGSQIVWSPCGERKVGLQRV